MSDENVDNETNVVDLESVRFPRGHWVYYKNHCGQIVEVKGLYRVIRVPSIPKEDSVTFENEYHEVHINELEISNLPIFER